MKTTTLINFIYCNKIKIFNNNLYKIVLIKKITYFLKIQLIKIKNKFNKSNKIRIFQIKIKLFIKIYKIYLKIIKIFYIPIIILWIKVLIFNKQLNNKIHNYLL